MKIGKEVSKMVATFIIQKVLEDDDGLAYICATVERFFAVARVLDMVLKSIGKQHAPRLLKLIISCYSRLSDNHRAGIALTSCLPNVFRNDTFNNYIREDPTTWRLVEHLYENVGMNQVEQVKEKMFKCVVHHSGEFAREFANFTKSVYQGLEAIWDVDSDYWSYFEILAMLKDLGYPTVNKLWYYDEMNACDIVLLEDEKGTKRMQIIAVMTRECHLYVTHPVSQPDNLERPRKRGIEKQEKWRGMRHT
ncbi:hypothetical protein KIW84_020383 [Lathyrus oleraceus]|uniref:PB1-like domain-containing protein n=1 Tax=Pisum sativum TaxID=3888 RepID=A0A9D5B7T5_PEA|nr:hypothetical protein KIW84_020383 [Pisum sativum]